MIRWRLWRLVGRFASWLESFAHRRMLRAMGLGPTHHPAGPTMNVDLVCVAERWLNDRRETFAWRRVDAFTFEGNQRTQTGDGDG